MSSYNVRGIYVVFALGGSAVLFARGIAYWFNWAPWTIRWIGLGLLACGVLGIFTDIGTAAGVKGLVAVVICAGAYIWQDIGLERREAEEKAEEQQRLLR